VVTIIRAAEMLVNSRVPAFSSSVTWHCKIVIQNGDTRNIESALKGNLKS